LAAKIASLNEQAQRIDDDIDMTTSKLYVQGTTDGADVPEYENLKDRFKKRPAAVTDAALIAANLELDIGATMATLHLWTAIVLFMSRNFLAGGLSLRKSWKKYNSLYKEIQKADSNVEQDVRDSIEAGVGAFLYSVSVIPNGILKSVLKVIGFKEDQDLGISLVWDVLFRQGSEIPMVFLVLAANYLFLASELDLESSLAKFRPVLEYCLHRYNTGLTFKFVASVFVKKTGHIHSAVAHLKSGIEHCEKLKNEQADDIVPSSFYIDLSQAYLYLYNYAEAENILNRGFSAPFEFTKKGLVALHLAVCQLRLGKTENLDLLLQNMTKLAKDFKQETYTNTKAKLLSQCKTTQDRDLLLSVAAYEMMYYWREIPSKADKEASIEKFDKEIGPISKITIPDIKAAASIIYGNFIASQDKEKAMQYFTNAVNMKKQIKVEKQWIAFAHYELANLEYTHEKYDVALGHLKVVGQMKSFPFDDVLKTRAKALEKLARVKALENGDTSRQRAKTF